MNIKSKGCTKASTGQSPSTALKIIREETCVSDHGLSSSRFSFGVLSLSTRNRQVYCFISHPMSVPRKAKNHLQKERVGQMLNHKRAVCWSWNNLHIGVGSCVEHKPGGNLKSISSDLFHFNPNGHDSYVNKPPAPRNLKPIPSKASKALHNLDICKSDINQTQRFINHQSSTSNGVRIARNRQHSHANAGQSSYFVNHIYWYMFLSETGKRSLMFSRFSSETRVRERGEWVAVGWRMSGVEL